MQRLFNLTRVKNMSIKYLRYLLPKHFAKVLLPVFFLFLLFLIKDTITEQVMNYLYKKNAKNTQLFDIRLLGENADFARALADKREKHFEENDYDAYINREFIKKQKNDIRIVKKSQNVPAIIKETKNRAMVAAVLPPAPVYELGSIFLGNVKRFAVINKIVVRVGETLPSGEKVADIKEGKVLLKGRWGNRWIYVNY